MIKEIKEVEGLNAQETILATLEAQQDDLKIQQENAEIDEDNRRLDHDSY